MPHDMIAGSAAAADRPRASAGPIRAPRWLTLVFAAFAVGMGLYGLGAIDTGRTNVAGVYDETLAQRRIDIQESVVRGESDGIEMRSLPSSGPVISALSAATGNPQAFYGKDGVYDTEIYYAQMPKKDIAILSAHNVMGGICMLFGALQFWPAFRRRFPRWHRGFGMAYMVMAQLGMIAAMTYMTITPLSRMYDRLTFVTGLWFLALAVTLSLWMSVYHLARREYAQHQAYMALNYGLLLTAPFTRIDWAWAVFMFPSVSQNVSNLVATAILIPQCIVFGYLLLCMNRWLQVSRPAGNPARPLLAPAAAHWLGGFFKVLLTIAALAGAAAVLQHYLLAPGFDRFVAGRALIPASVVELQSAMLAGHEVSRLLYALTAIGALLFAPVFLWATFREDAARLPWAMPAAAGMAALCVINGLVLLFWGWLLGAPSAATSSGGAPYAMNGAFTLGFGLALGSALLRRRLPMVKELGLFAILCVLALPSFYGFVPFLNWLYTAIGIADLPHYIATGHLYRVAISTGLILLFGGIVYAAYGSATRERFAR